MKESRDVKKITDIPGIENYLNNVFKFKCYDQSDGLAIFEFEEPGEKKISLEIHKEVHKYLFYIDKLIEIISDEEEIQYLQWTERDFFEDKLLRSFCYRPLVSDDEKEL